MYGIIFVLLIQHSLVLTKDFPIERVSNYSKTDRMGKFWPGTTVRFENGVCKTLGGYDGTCYTKHQCRSIRGTATGQCANGLGTCCIAQGTCGGTSSSNNTYFVNAGYPNINDKISPCCFTIQKYNPDICQVRLDFFNMHLAQPDGNGNCNEDAFTIIGSASRFSPICGENSGQHIYVNFNDKNDIKLCINVGDTINMDRSWSIKIAQIVCGSYTEAPSGCLMYYRGLSDTVNSFNYGTTISGALIDIGMNMLRPGTREIANLNYGVCVQMRPGYCSIEWTQGPDPTSFTVSGNTALSEVDPGLPSDGMMGADCTTDYIVVPNAYFTNGTAANTDRFCGNQLPTIRTASKPFVMTVVTNGDDLTDVANRGFSLNYRQLPCNGLSSLSSFLT